MELDLLIFAWTWSLNWSLLSMITPRSLSDVLMLRGVPFSLYCLLLLPDRLMVIETHLLGLNVRSDCSVQEYMLLISCCRDCWSVGFVISRKILASSAKRKVGDIVVSGKELMKMMKRMGPSTDP